MKKVIIALFCLWGGMAAHAQDIAPGTQTGSFSFAEETHDYGIVPEGPLAECDFVFTNIGKAPIIISRAVGSCGCTVPEWTREPVKPGETGKMHVKYTTAGHPGLISKEITVFSNAQQPIMVLHIRGTVVPAPAVGTQTANVRK